MQNVREIREITRQSEQVLGISHKRSELQIGNWLTLVFNFRNVKMVVALKKKDENDLLLEFSQVIPLYVSPNEKVGSDESEYFFPFDYADDDDEEMMSHKEATSEDDAENVEGDDVAPVNKDDNKS